MTTEEQLLELAWAIERISVEVQELANSSASVIGTMQQHTILMKMAAVNRRIMEVFPDVAEMPR